MSPRRPKLAKREVIIPDGAVVPPWLHIPDFVMTEGPEVAEVCAAANFEPYPEQALCLNLLFAVGANGLAAAFELDVIAARQQLKTGLVVQADIGWMYVTEEPLVNISAHNGKAVTEVFTKTVQVIKGSPVLSKRLRPGPSNGIISGKGDQEFELRGGRRTLFMVRTPDNGRALSANKVVLDEAYAATGAQTGALYPTLGAMPDPQILLVSSACKEDSEVLREARDSGRQAAEDQADGRETIEIRQAYVEYGDPDAWTGCEDEGCDHHKTRQGCVLDDEERWKRILPRHEPRRLEVVRQLRRSMTAEEFARELMVWHTDPVKAGKSVLPNWAACELDDEDGEIEAPTAGLVLGVAVAPDLSWSSIAAGSRWPDGRIHLAAVMRQKGVAWLAADLKDRQDRNACAVVLDEKCPDTLLLTRLDKAGVEYVTFEIDEMLEAYSWLQSAVREGDVTHFGYDELDDAIDDAKNRSIGDRLLPGRRVSAGEISMLEAAMVAGYGVDQGITGGAFNIY